MVRILLLVLTAVAVAVLTLEGTVIVYLLAASWIITLAAIGIIVVRPRRAGEGSRAPRTCGSVIVSILVISQAGLSLAVAVAARRMALDAVSASNLRGIGEGLREYCSRFGASPASFDDLLTSGISTPGQFICPWSDDQESPDGKLVSSYVYFGGEDVCSGDPRRPVAAERGTWTALGLRVFFRRYGHAVLFADGHVKAVETGDATLLYR